MQHPFALLANPKLKIRLAVRKALNESDNIAAGRVCPVPDSGGLLQWGKLF